MYSAHRDYIVLSLIKKGVNQLNNRISNKYTEKHSNYKSSCEIQQHNILSGIMPKNHTKGVVSMNKRNIVLSILLSVVIVSNSLAPVSASENQALNVEIPSINSNVEDEVSSNFISGQLTEKSSDTPENIVKRYYNKNSISFENSNFIISSLYAKAEQSASEAQQPAADKQFRITKQFKNSMGRTVVQTIQTYNDVPVYGTDQNYHVNSNGVIECISGSNVENIESKVVSSSSLASEEDVLKAVENHIGFKPEYLEAPKYELVLYPVNNTYVYSYKVSIKFNKPCFGDFVYYVDSNNLSILEIYSNIASAEEPAVGSGIGQFGTEKKDLKMVKDENNTYYLKNTVENSVTVTGAGIIFSEGDNFFDSGTPENYQQDAVDAHYNISNVLKFFKETFNRNGNDDKGSTYQVYIDGSDKSFNAYGSQNFMRVCVGHGKGVRSTACALDATAHEFAHGMLFSEGLSLPWYVKATDECVALHEGISDVFGTICEYYVSSEGPFDWTMAEDTGDVIRDCSNPVIDDYNDYLNSNRDPHDSAGVISKAAYLMAEGGTHNGKSVNAIGYDKMANIFYKTVNDGYLVSEMKFRQFAEAAVQAASLAYGISSAEIQTVKDAFAAVGIFRDLLQSLTINMRSGLRIQLGWDTNGISADTFGIYRKIAKSADASEKLIETTDSKVSVDTLIGSCEFYLAKVDSQGNRISDFSNAVNVESYYGSPQNFKWSNRSGLQVEFTWTGMSDAKYAIYRKATDSADVPKKVIETANNVISLYTLLGSYDFYVARIDSAGSIISYLSQPITVRSYYLPPQKFTITDKNSSSVQLSWIGNPDSSFAIYRKATESTDAPEKLATVDTPKATVDTLKGSNDFYVAQVDSSGYRISCYSTALTVESN